MELDPGFADFYLWCRSNNVTLIVVSGGMKPLISALLGHRLGQGALENIEIISNDATVDENGAWDIVYRDDTIFGHDKSNAIRPYNRAPAGQRPLLFYCGDGVSDLSAARETDLLFAKRGRDLITFCKREGIPFHTFDSFRDIQHEIESILSGNKQLEDSFEN